MPLCESCSEIDLRPLLAVAHERNIGKEYIGPEPVTEDILPWKHPRTTFQARVNAENCEFCKKIWEVAEQSRWQSTWDLDTDEEQAAAAETDEPVFVYVLGRRYGQYKAGALQFTLQIMAGMRTSRYSGTLYRNFKTGKAVLRIWRKTKS